MLAEGIDPIASKQQAKAEAVVRGHTFERVALDWHKEMSVKWALNEPPERQDTVSPLR
ncbi:integrase [Pseudomonas aeruginosa]|nr:integrase [Pseudomonas aeruginosa]